MGAVLQPVSRQWHLTWVAFPFFSVFADKSSAARVLLLLDLIPAWLGAAGTRYQIDPERSSIEFEVRHLVSTVSGSFAKFSGVVEFDPDDVARCRAEATIDVGSLVTDDARRTGRLARDDFFATAKFPTMLFESQSWRRTGDGAWAVAGKLTIKGITREIVLHVREQPNHSADNRRWEARAKLNREDFGLSGGPPGLIGDEVSFMLKIEAAGTRVSDPVVRAIMIDPDERGERLLLHGTVFAADGRTPVPNARLRIFHTDADGLYSRGADNSEGERNPRLNVVLRTDADGRYEVQTIVPGRYPGGKTPAHVHMTVSAEGYRERTATFSFAGDPALTPEDYERHGRDGTFSSVRPLERIEEGAWRCQRDIRLEITSRRPGSSGGLPIRKRPAGTSKANVPDLRFFAGILTFDYLRSGARCSTRLTVWGSFDRCEDLTGAVARQLPHARRPISPVARKGIEILQYENCFSLERHHLAFGR